MLENSGLVLCVDSSFGLLTRFHYPRHVSVALLVHGWLIHLGEAGGSQRQMPHGSFDCMCTRLCNYAIALWIVFHSFELIEINALTALMLDDVE